MSPWLKPAQQSPTPHYPDPTILHVARRALISPQIYGWLLITSLIAVLPIDKFEGQPTLEYTAKEQREQEKTDEARGTERKGDVSLSDRTSPFQGRRFIAFSACDVWAQPFVSSSFPPRGLRGYGDGVCQRVYKSYHCCMQTCQGPAPDHVTWLKDIFIPGALASF